MFPSNFEIRPKQQERQRHVTKMFGSCPSKLNDEILPLRFGFSPK